uniref:Porcine arterivirus-type cysteine proteinase alpha n=1 Tax=Myoviridae sp. ctjhW4 TaxID=2825162 RepID=A0A8S5PRF7_9CAUD|nr:MAG TPA: Porcine arterivirus-type cysteine proteinase alpha [Myoviridae sp. ctjhW4]
MVGISKRSKNCISSSCCWYSSIYTVYGING